jgi:hypothetical protein
MKTATQKVLTEFGWGRTIRYFDETPEKRPQDPRKNGKVMDAEGRHCTYVPTKEPKPGKLRLTELFVKGLSAGFRR